ncbi:hypothetical protein PRZ48_011426 [Zasmidium cellare]|uniref:Endo-1,5-alpha-L-arabinanase A n=1 Tax=Zasmidium cellare TaxID=395010 RepID=A0ABR0E6C1_ZASCE|nr:hypothetical protein PRZ48_011426 [Zasmidium cellare]
MNLPNRNFAQWRRIDGNILSDASDPQGVVSPYMAFNSFGYGIYGIELNSDYLTAKNVEPKLLIKSQDQPGGNRTEGAFQLRHNGYIYLFYSRGSCCSGGDADPQSVYRTQVCRTNASTPAGPYYDRDNVDCSNGPTSRPGSTILYPTTHNWEPGSVSVLLDPKEGLIMTYQYVDTTRQSPGPFLELEALKEADDK